MHFVYIIYSEKLNRFYVGSTSDLGSRVSDHNKGKSVYTAKGRPWILIKFYDGLSHSDALKLEKKIKGRGAKRYLQEND